MTAGDTKGAAPFAGLVGVLSGTAPAGAAAMASGLPPGARYLGRFVSVSHALVAYGVPLLEAATLAGRNRRPKPAEVRHTLPTDAPRLAGCTLIVRRMSGNHAEAWAVGERPAAGPAPAAPAGSEGVAR
ncbi:MAG: hypothetical protein ACK5Y7_11285 [Betaproteobacteria bacterium]|jgi:hypothetical protein|nr:hypothetical protein [Rubrivivax sp.]